MKRFLHIAAAHPAAVLYWSQISKSIEFSTEDEGEDGSVEDKRIKTAKTKMKTNDLQKEAELDKSINKETKSVKERLIDLKSMFNEDLITKEEYEEQRKNLISEI